jgi:hypothetical protein
MHIMKRLLGLALLIGSSLATMAQDLHYADVQQMGQWYNQSLKRNREGELHANFRDIRYQSLLAFRTGTLLLNLPVGQRKDTANAADRGFFNVSLGASFDQTNTEFYRGTTGLLGLSYAQPLNRSGLFAAVGFQGTLTTNKYGATGTFPDQFNEYGPITGAVTNDPLRAGYKFSYFSLNAGASLFQTGTTLEWYLGASVRHLNRPFTENNKLADFKLNPTTGLQGGITYRADRSSVSAYGTGTWKGKASEILVGAQYELLFSGDNQPSSKYKSDDEQDVSLTLGCAVRIKDALIPAVGLNYNRTRVALHYDMNTSSIRTSGYIRRGFELVLTQKF